MANQTTSGQTAIIGNKQTLRSLVMREDITASLEAIRNHCMTTCSIREQAVLAVTENPELLKCTPVSFLAALRHLGQIGLPFSGPGALAHLVPFGHKVVPIVNYRGLASLARRSGLVRRIEARVVCEKDKFDVSYGSRQHITHKPHIGADRGRIIAAYAIGELRDGSCQIEVMSRDEIEKIKNRSRAGGRGPWATDFSEMSRKTVLRRLLKYLPSIGDIEQVTQTENDGEELPRAKSIEATQFPSDDFDGGQQVDTDTGEVLEDSQTENQGSEEKEHLLNQIRDELISRWPGDSPEAKTQKLDEIRYIFGAESWSKVCTLSEDILTVGLGEIQRRANIPEDEAAQEEAQPDKTKPFDPASEKKQLLTQIRDELVRQWPGDSKENKKLKKEEISLIFGCQTWQKVTILTNDILGAGLRVLRDRATGEEFFRGDDIPF